MRRLTRREASLLAESELAYWHLLSIMLPSLPRRNEGPALPFRGPSGGDDPQDVVSLPGGYASGGI